MAPKYKLIYFPARGRAEHLRLMFLYAKQPFEDVRVSPEEWKKIKPTVPFGQIPVLEIDGVMYEQSVALARYLAKQFSLDGQDDLQRLRADIFVAHVMDLLDKHVLAIFTEKDETKKAALMKKLHEEDIPSFFGKFEKIIVKNGGFTAGKSILWSDIFFTTALDMMTTMGFLPKAELDKYPSVVKIMNAVESHPNIKAYIEKRESLETPLPILMKQMAEQRQS